MKKLCLCIAFLLLIAGEGVAQDLFYAKNFVTTFFSEARIENIKAISTKGTSVINTLNREVAFKIPIQSFKFDNGLMQEHFNENYLESDKYPNATFKGKIMEEVDLSRKGNYKVAVKGQLSMHGVTKERTITGIIEVKENQVTITSSFIVPVQDHQINIPNDKISNISQDIKVMVKAVYEPKK